MLFLNVYGYLKIITCNTNQSAVTYNRIRMIQYSPRQVILTGILIDNLITKASGIKPDALYHSCILSIAIISYFYGKIKFILQCNQISPCLVSTDTVCFQNALAALLVFGECMDCIGACRSVQSKRLAVLTFKSSSNQDLLKQ